MNQAQDHRFSGPVTVLQERRLPERATPGHNRRYLPKTRRSQVSTKRRIGDRREDGYVYYGKSEYEIWLSPRAYHRRRIQLACASAKRRARKKDVPFSLTTDYLLSIYPGDNKCPALGVELEWGRDNGRGNSPSLDRIVPENGYVEGNVVFISNRANQIKSDATADEVQRVATFLRSITDT